MCTAASVVQNCLVLVWPLSALGQCTVMVVIGCSTVSQPSPAAPLYFPWPLPLAAMKHCSLERSLHGVSSTCYGITMLSKILPTILSCLAVVGIFCVLFLCYWIIFESRKSAGDCISTKLAVRQYCQGVLRGKSGTSLNCTRL
uniref:Secreted protein n=1 Tax=Amblyomma cajennense TaxID=34607 RepID=A0A023FC08_AMBCJ